MFRATTPELPVPTAADLALHDLPRTIAAHDAHMAQVPGMSLIESGGTAGAGALALPVRVAAWNLERCLFPEPAARHVADCDVVLVSEMDHGMARSSQRTHGCREGSDIGHQAPRPKAPKQAHSFGTGR